MFQTMIAVLSAVTAATIVIAVTAVVRIGKRSKEEADRLRGEIELQKALVRLHDARGRLQETILSRLTFVVMRHQDDVGEGADSLQ